MGNVIKKWWPVFLVVAFLSLFYLQYTIFTASDLGRHLVNGRVILQEGTVFETNRYSYTYPDFPAANHHWLFGVLAYGLVNTTGFVGLSLISALLYVLATLVVVYTVAKLFGNTVLPSGTAAAVLLILPALTHRYETRPEVISTVLFAVMMMLTATALTKKNTAWWMYFIVFVTSAVWVNSHIFFFLGAAILAAGTLASVLRKQSRTALSLAGLLLAYCAGAVINPLGLYGVWYPFTILSEYGYDIAENQSLVFFYKYHPEGKYWFFGAVTILIGALQLWRMRWWWKSSVRLFFWLLPVPLYFVFWYMNRFASFWSLAVLPLAIVQVSAVVRELKQQSFFTSPAGIGGMTVTVAVLCMIGIGTRLYLPFDSTFGVGLIPRALAGGQFFSSLKLTGPIFNNYDIGGYLIYSLYPDQKVYVDNRPEAYPSAFLKDEYVTPQENEEAWQALDAQYIFGSIYFYRHDATSWAQDFLIRRIQDDRWVPVFVDETTIIMIRNIPEHTEIIEKYALPKEMFQIRQRT